MSSIETRIDELATECFDESGAFARDFLRDDLEPDVLDVVVAVGAHLRKPYDPDAWLTLDRAWGRLRDRFIQADRELFRVEAEQEMEADHD